MARALFERDWDIYDAPEDLRERREGDLSPPEVAKARPDAKERRRGAYNEHGYLPDNGNEWPVKVSALHIGLEVRTPAGWKPVTGPTRHHGPQTIGGVEYSDGEQTVWARRVSRSTKKGGG